VVPRWFAGGDGVAGLEQHQGAIMKSILDPTFRYTSSAATDLRKTFARIRREQAEAAKRAELNKTNVSALKRKAQA
jgi:hypothetical protein